MKTRLVLIIVLCGLLLAIAGLAYLGAFTRLHADDFCIAADVNHLGFWPSLGHWYNTWTGRYSFLFFNHLASLGGPLLAAASPAGLALGWGLLLGWALFPLLRRAGLPYLRLLSAASAAFILLVLFSSTPNLFQSFFWQDGQVNYTYPLLSVTLLAGWLLHYWLDGGTRLGLTAAGVFLLALLCGGFTEIFDTLQIALWLLAVLSAWFFCSAPERRRLLPLLLAALAGALLAMALVAIAPGNQVRSSALVERAGLVQAVLLTLRSAAAIAAKFFVWNPFWAAMAVAAPFLTTWTLLPASPAAAPSASLRALWAESWFRALLLVPLAAFGLLAAACFPVAFIMNAYPEDRSIFVPQYALVLAVMAASALLAYGLRRLQRLPAASSRPLLRIALPAVLLGAVLLASGLSLAASLRAIPNYQAYAAAWDARHAQLLATPQHTEVTVPGLENRFGVADLRAEPDYWVNACMAGYYDLAAVRGR